MCITTGIKQTDSEETVNHSREIEIIVYQLQEQVRARRASEDNIRVVEERGFEGIQCGSTKVKSNKRMEISEVPTRFVIFSLSWYISKYIKGFSKIAKPMTKLTQKKVKFEWGDKQEAAFQLLKQKLCSEPILALPKEAKHFHRITATLQKGFGRCV
ncbi:hypothetical protein Tco_0248145 [Tanacetum coccineum]